MWARSLKDDSSDAQLQEHFKNLASNPAVRKAESIVLESKVDTLWVSLERLGSDMYFRDPLEFLWRCSDSVLECPRHFAESSNSVYMF